MKVDPIAKLERLAELWRRTTPGQYRLSICEDAAVVNQPGRGMVVDPDEHDARFYTEAHNIDWTALIAALKATIQRTTIHD
jgi:Ni,Fe-hydrogenase maturation factor